MRMLQPGPRGFAAQRSWPTAGGRLSSCRVMKAIRGKRSVRQAFRPRLRRIFAVRRRGEAQGQQQKGGESQAHGVQLGGVRWGGTAIQPL